MRNLFDSEGRRVGWLITELERQTADRLSEESRQDLLDEVACHLDAAIQARLELGMSPIEAEREAVEAFGHPKSYVDDLLRIHEESGSVRPRRSLLVGDRPTMVAFWAVTLYSMTWILAGKTAPVMPALIVGFTIVGPVFAFLSYRARRIQPFAILASSALACLLMTLVCTLTWHNLWAHGGVGVVPRWEDDTRLASDQQTTAQLQQFIVPLEQRAEVHAKFSRPPFRIQPSPAELCILLETPVLRDIPETFSPNSSIALSWVPKPDSSITFEACPTLQASLSSWKDKGRPLLDALISRKMRLDDGIAAISAARSAPIMYDFPMNLGQMAVAVPFWFGIWAIVNLIFGGLGWLLPRLRGARPRSIA